MNVYQDRVKKDFNLYVNIKNLRKKLIIFF